VAGVSLRDGFSENEIDDGLEGGEEDGRELKVPVGEPSGVNTAGRSVLAVVRCMKRPCEFHSWGSMRWNARAASYRCVGGGGVTRTVGTSGILGTEFWVLGTGFAGTGSGIGFWQTEKTRARNDRFESHHLSPRGWVQARTLRCSRNAQAV
jgi:hypothetical protein